MRGPSPADLVAAHLWIVDHFHSKYRRLSTGADLVAAGTQGLCEAAARFEPQKGRQFSTYAWNWVKGYMLRELRTSHVVAVPEHTARRALAEGKPIRGVVVFDDRESGSDEPIEQEVASDRSMRRRVLLRLAGQIAEPALRALALRVLSGESLESLAEDLGMAQARLEQQLERVERLLAEAYWMEGADNLSPAQVREVVRDLQVEKKKQKEVIDYLQGQLTQEKKLAEEIAREKNALARENQKLKSSSFAELQLKKVRRLLRLALKELRA